MSSRIGARRDPSVAVVRLAAPHLRVGEATRGPRWIPLAFAAKTTGSGLLALLLAFACDLDQPKWALLTVFIVAQPQSGFVLAKGFYRVIGTVLGAVVALLLVSLFAQERVLFLGVLASWIGLCTFASVNGRNFAAYGFVLSGYTAAIVGIPGALDPDNAFFLAVARVTEISLGIMTTGAISHLVLPVSLAASLQRAVTAAQADLGEVAAAVLARLDAHALRVKLLEQVTAIENLRSSAIFEDREVRAQSAPLRALTTAMLNLLEATHLLDRVLDRPVCKNNVADMQASMTEVAAAVDLWRNGALDAAGLQQHLLRANAELPLARELCRKRLARDEEVIRSAGAIIRLREFGEVFVAFVRACETFQSSNGRSSSSARVVVANDPVGATWAGLRAAMALLLAGTFWILADWPSGATATILAALVTARLATMEHALAAATGASLLIAIAIIPFFIVLEIVLPNTAGFVMFALVVAPMMFLCAYMMAYNKTAGLGFIAGLFFAYGGGFQDRMTYDPVGFLNTSIAIVVAVATAAVLFSIVVPDTPKAARWRFARVARRMFRRVDRSRRVTLDEFESAMAEALRKLRQDLRPDRGEDIATVEAGVALLSVGRELIRLRDAGWPTPADIAVNVEVVRFLGSGHSFSLSRARRAASDATAGCLAALRDDGLGVMEARAAARAMVALTAVHDGLDRCHALFSNERATDVVAHAA